MRQCLWHIPSKKKELKKRIVFDNYSTKKTATDLTCNSIRRDYMAIKELEESFDRHDDSEHLINIFLFLGVRGIIAVP